MPNRPEQTIAYRVYHDGNDLIGVATLEMPEVKYMTETLSGSGVAGEIENPTIGITESLSVKFSFTSVETKIFHTLDWTASLLLPVLGLVGQNMVNPQPVLVRSSGIGLLFSRCLKGLSRAGRYFHYHIMQPKISPLQGQR